MVHIAKYLGVIFGKQLTFGQHVKQTVTKAKKVTSMLYPVINRRSPISLNIKLLLLNFTFVHLSRTVAKPGDHLSANHDGKI